MKCCEDKRKIARTSRVQMHTGHPVGCNEPPQSAYSVEKLGFVAHLPSPKVSRCLLPPNGLADSEGIASAYVNPSAPRRRPRMSVRFGGLSEVPELVGSECTLAVWFCLRTLAAKQKTLVIGRTQAIKRKPLGSKLESISRKLSFRRPEFVPGFVSVYRLIKVRPIVELVVFPVRHASRRHYMSRAFRSARAVERSSLVVRIDSGFRHDLPVSGKRSVRLTLAELIAFHRALSHR
jgi:hypothetical protein